jgi:hypothetical protein
MEKYDKLAAIDENPLTNPQTVIVGIPRPEIGYHHPLFAKFRQIGLERTTDVWRRIDEEKLIQLKIIPEDIYAQGGAAYLPCSKELPIVRHMGLIFVHDKNLTHLNGLYHKDGTGGHLQMFATLSGPQYYMQLNPKWLNLTVPLLYLTNSETSNPVSLFETASPSVKGDILGISPFTNYQFQLSTTAGDEYTTFGLNDALGMFVVFELERIQAVKNLEWVQNCKRP